MRTAPVWITFVVMALLVAAWWVVTGRTPVTPVASPQIASRGDALLQRLNQRYGPLWTPDASPPDLPPRDAVQNLGTLKVQGGQLQGESLSPAALETWKTVTGLLTPELLKQVEQFSLMSDGVGGTRGWLMPAEGNPAAWRLVLDPSDGTLQGRLSTLVYQSASLLAMAPTELASLKSGEVCKTVQTSLGCLRQEAMMNRYFQTFWAGNLVKEWSQRQIGGDLGKAQQFAASHPGTFPNVAAARGPEQDFAAAWTAFVLGPRPEKEDTVARRKAAFFYSDPQWTTWRLRLLRKVGTTFSQRP